jgi:hypothetical protein
MKTGYAIGTAAMVLLLLAGCVLAGGVVMTGTLSAAYFVITSDVTVTISQGDLEYSLPVPMGGSGVQVGSLILANIPAGTYSVAVSFESNDSTVAGTLYSVDGGPACGWGDRHRQHDPRTRSPSTRSTSRSYDARYRFGDTE